MNGLTIDLIVGLIPVGMLMLFVLWRVVINIERITGPGWAPGEWRTTHTRWRHGHPHPHPTAPEPDGRPAR